MTKLNVINSVKRTFYKTKFQIQKRSPEILIVTGVIGTVASAVMACRATTKVSTIMEKTKADIDDIHYKIDNPNLVDENYQPVTYTQEEANKDLAIIYFQTGIKLARLYAPSVALGALSLTGIVASHNILRKRNLAIAAAYTAIDQSFKGYRGRVVERFGEELDKELRYNIKAQEVKETVVDENGKKKTVKRTINVSDPNFPSDIACCFTTGCTGWTKDPELNMTFLKLQQNYANDILRERGYLFLNEVYDMLGIPRSRAGHVGGWVYAPNDPNHKGDNYVDFGIYNINNEENCAFVNRQECSIWLDFNIDGDIMHKVKF